MTTPNEELRARLPELPEPAARFHVQHFMQNPGMRNTELCEVQDFGQGSHSLYTAEQLQDYAIAALARQEEGREAIETNYGSASGGAGDGRASGSTPQAQGYANGFDSRRSHPAPPSGGEGVHWSHTPEFARRVLRTGAEAAPSPTVTLATPTPQAAGVSEADATKWMPVKPEGAPYWGIHTADGETIVGTSSGLSERHAQLICDAVNGDLPTAHDDLTLELVEVTEERDHLRRALAGNANAASAEIAEAALRQIRDSTFRSALQLRAIADRALTAAGAAPEGFVLVPREPTPEMLAAVRGWEETVLVAEDDHREYPISEDTFAAAYSAMLAATPNPGAQHGQECQHADTRTGYDSVTCTNCGAFKTDSQWGIAQNRWFRSRADAEFYRQNGRLPEAQHGQEER